MVAAYYTDNKQLREMGGKDGGVISTTPAKMICTSLQILCLLAAEVWWLLLLHTVSKQKQNLAQGTWKVLI